GWLELPHRELAGARGRRPVHEPRGVTGRVGTDRAHGVAAVRTGACRNRGRRAERQCLLFVSDRRRLRRNLHWYSVAHTTGATVNTDNANAPTATSPSCSPCEP